MYVIKVLVRLPGGSFEELPIAKYSGPEDDREPVALQWDQHAEAQAFAERNLPGMECLIEDVELEMDDVIDTHYRCTGCNTTPCDCSDELITNTGSLR